MSQSYLSTIVDDLKSTVHKPVFGALDILRYIGPGLLVTVGFIDPGNWASNMAAGADYGYALLWMVTLSTAMLIVLQHNAAHLGIASGLCLSEAAHKYLPRYASRIILATAMLASVSTSLAEILGASIALNMLFAVPIKLAAPLVTVFILIMLFTNSYRHIERWIIAFVSVIGLSFIYELALVHVQWGQAAAAWVTPSFPHGSMPIIMSVLGAVVMPHNLFLHSEIIQSRQWNLQDETTIKKQLSYEFLDTLFSMLAGWAINSAMIILAAATFYAAGQHITQLQDAKRLLEPLVGVNAGFVFAVALLFSGIASTITSGMAAGTISAGMTGEPFDMKDIHSKLGVAVSLIGAMLLIFFIGDPFKGLVISQMVLSIQLPITVFLQIRLTSSKEVMGVYANSLQMSIALWTIGAIVTILNVMLFVSLIKG